ncbi:SIR2 family protein [Flavobacterium sp. J27]|uniref:SIR2 family protein n=1 Tax=Flavobacterium sp. J27 TaxID=2060419 RepID=UPI0010313D96|nr:SIR2 family protein [Flavobacterium sp. J27]
MINKFLADIKVIKNAINTKRLVIFAGAGISIDAGAPSWWKLIDEIKNELDLPENENDFLKIPQIYYNERQEKEYVEKIRTILRHKKLKHNEIHEEILELNPEHILTTNFEDLLEQVINKKSLPYSVVKEDKDLPYSYNTKLLVKIHGDLDNSNFVLKEDDYLNYSFNHPLIEAFIKSIFATKVVLFIGYSYNDNNLKQIIQNVRNILGNNFQNAYLLSIDNHIHSSQKLYLKNKGVNVLDYFESEIITSDGNKTNYILEFLKGNNILKEKYYQKPKTLSEKGQLLYNFLRFIKFYDEFKIIINEENIIDKIYDSFNRFSELKSLPQNFIAKLYPFKSTKKNIQLVQDTTLILYNKELVDFFYNRIVIEDNQIKYLSNKIISDYERKIIEKKLQTIITKLNNSLIFEVTKENSNRDSLGYKGFSKESKDILLIYDSKCQCSKCKFKRFQFYDSIREINSYLINETTDISDDIENAYLNYKIGNYRTSFNMFQEIASKAWETGKYITYYIAKNNMKSLNGLISMNEDGVNEEENDKIKEIISDIDTDKLISQIPYKSNEEYELLKIIRDDSILNQVQNHIDDLFEKIEYIYLNYKDKRKNTSVFGSYYPQLVYIQLHKLLNFYTANNIISDEYSNFKKVIKKGIEALVMSYSTSNEYQGRLDKFTTEFFRICVSYGDLKFLIKIFEKYDVKKLEFDEKDIDTILDNYENFFNSFSTNIKLFDNSHINILNQLNKDSFEMKMKTTFNNMIFLLSSIEIPKRRVDNFINNLLTFLENEDFIYGDGVKYLNYFIEDNPSFFNKENCMKLLKLSHNHIRKYEMYNTIETISDIVNINNIILLEDIDYVLKLKSDFLYYNPRYDLIVMLWRMSNLEIKEKLQTLLIEKLNNNFNDEIYRVASEVKMIDYNLFFDDYIIFLNKVQQINNDYTYEYNKVKWNNYNNYFAILFLYQMKIKSSDVRLKKLQNLKDYMNFFVYREKSDLSLFKVEWLKLIKYELIYDELKKIKPLHIIIEQSLKDNYDEEISKIYFKYLK